MFLCLCHVHGKQRKQHHANLSAAWPRELAFFFITEFNASAEQRLTLELYVCSEQRACPLAGGSGVGTASNKNLEGVLWKQKLICIYKGPNYICKVEWLRNVGPLLSSLSFLAPPPNLASDVQSVPKFLCHTLENR